MSSICISEVQGNSQRLDGGSMFGNAPRAVWEKWTPPDELSRIPLACRALLIEIDGQKILCETGIGAFFDPKLAERFGIENHERHMLLENLKNLGLDHGDIDYVILSHLHFDHAGGLLPTYNEIQAGNDELLFSKAKFLVGIEAFARAENPHSRDRASFIPGLTEKLKNTGRLVLVDGPTCPGVFEDRLSFFTSHGHTPGQMHTVFQGDSSKICFTGDLVPGKAWVHLPITMGYDRFAEKVIDEKQELYKKAVAENWWLFFTHDAESACSKVIVDEKGKYQASEPQNELVRKPL